MPLPATDNFNRADGPVGANWTATSASGHEVETNKVIAAIAGYCFSHWNADTFDNDHYSQAVLSGLHAHSGLTVRQAAGTDCYAWFASAAGTVYRMDNGGFNLIASGVPIPADGSVIKMTVEGSSIKLFDDGAQIGSTITDATYASGSAGLVGYDSGGGTRAFLDDWEGGNMVAAAKAFPFQGRHPMAHLLVR